MHGCTLVPIVQSCVRSVIVLLLAAAIAPVYAQSPPRDGVKDVDVSELPISVERIQEDLRTPSTLSFEVVEPLFRVEIVARRPPDWLENIDWLGTRGRIGPTPPIPSLHDQYLARVTPREVQPFSSVAYTGGELIQVAVTSFLQQLATRKIVEEVPDQLRARREERARREVDDAIARWQTMVENERQKRQN